MERILIRYALRNKHTQVLHFKTYYLEQIEQDGIGKLFDIENYTVVSRDLFTGLLDKNGTKIFEGDVISDGDPMNTGEVELDIDCGCIFVNSHATLHVSQYCSHYSVTGNIHDHETA